MPTKAQISGDNLRGYRARARLSQAELADKIGVHVNTITNWENGKGGIAFDKAWELADLFGVTLDELAGRHT